eukprot:TRINITY_DN3255_c0_g1_i1.p1 TRINITY_DN3255_c0_g1~~TRINITY_DN3255_c0_g1_i1.p1  ORF type:complete len:224 (-),score=57.86 TRINITY_DN3255_c0_g1_i1:299-970(-)
MSESMEVAKTGTRGIELLNKGECAEAEPLLRAAVTATRKQNNAETFMWMKRLGEALVGQGKFAEAETYISSAQFGFKSWGEEDEDNLDCSYLLAEILYGQQRLPEAELLCKTALQGLENNQARGKEHMITLKCKALYAIILHMKGNDDGADVADAVREAFEAASLKSDALAHSGSRRPSVTEQTDANKVNNLLTKAPSRQGSKQATSRQGSKESTAASVVEVA